jgi:uncharacterized damage-inducible protein DinB
MAGLGMGGSDTELVVSTDLGPETDLLLTSVDDAVQRLVGAGATVVAEASDIPVGRVAVVRDPFGNDLTLVDLSKGRYATGSHRYPAPVRAVETIAYLLDQAFEGSEFHSLIGNLSAVDTEMWHARLPESVRTIGEIALHVGSCKVMYRDHAFGTAALTWESPEVEPWPPREARMADVIPWLRATHAAVMADVRGLADDDLLTPRRANWGDMRETRWLLATLAEHDTYHAGEINRMRTILSGEDRWQWQIELGIER